MSQKALEVFTSIIKSQNTVKGTVAGVSDSLMILTSQGIRYFAVGDFTNNDIGAQVEIENGKVVRLSSQVNDKIPVYTL